jgi:iron complex transport system ATP-binding protein
VEGKMEIQFSDLTLGYRGVGKRTIVAGPLSGVIEGEGITVLLGENGAGKTTLLKTLAGVIPPLGGRIEVGGKALNRMAFREIARTFSLDLGEQGIWQGLTPQELFAITARELRESEERAETIAERFGVVPFLRKSLRTLSEGERKRVLLARAFLPRVPFIFLDEPLAHLDLWQKEEILALIRGMAEKRGVLVTTHDLSILPTADRVAFLLPGGPLIPIPSGITRDPLLVREYLDGIREGSFRRVESLW